MDLLAKIQKVEKIDALVKKLQERKKSLNEEIKEIENELFGDDKNKTIYKCSEFTITKSVKAVKDIDFKKIDLTNPDAKKIIDKYVEDKKFSITSKQTLIKDLEKVNAGGDAITTKEDIVYSVKINNVSDEEKEEL